MPPWLGGVPQESGAPKDSPAAGLAGAAEEVSIDRYYPLQRFFSWTYAVTIVSGGATTSAEDTIRVETLSSGTSRTGALSIKRSIGGKLVVEGTGTLAVSSTEISINRGGTAEFIKLPLKPGNEWASGTLTVRARKVDRLVVGGTAYTGLIGLSYYREGEVVAERQAAPGIAGGLSYYREGEVVAERWLAPKVGVVKQFARTKADGAVVETTSELLSSKTIAVLKIALSPAASFSLTPAATAEISAIAAMAEDGLYSRDLAFSSSNTTIATVTKGVSTPSGLKATVTAVATGAVTITARSEQDPTKLATVSVEVK